MLRLSHHEGTVIPHAKNTSAEAPADAASAFSASLTAGSASSADAVVATSIVPPTGGVDVDAATVAAVCVSSVECLAYTVAASVDAAATLFTAATAAVADTLCACSLRCCAEPYWTRRRY